MGNSASSKPFLVFKINGRVVVKVSISQLQFRLNRLTKINMTRGQSEPKRLLFKSLIKFTNLNFESRKSPGLAYEQVFAGVEIDVKHKSTEIESRRRHPVLIMESFPSNFIVQTSDRLGFGFKNLASLVFKFHGTSDDEPSPLRPPPNHFYIVIKSNWSLISPRANYPINLGWPFFMRRLPAPEAFRYPTLCQYIKLEVPSELSQDTFHKSAAKVNQSICQIIIERKASCKVTPVLYA